MITPNSLFSVNKSSKINLFIILISLKTSLKGKFWLENCGPGLMYCICIIRDVPVPFFSIPIPELAVSADTSVIYKYIYCIYRLLYGLAQAKPFVKHEQIHGIVEFISSLECDFQSLLLRFVLFFPFALVKSLCSFAWCVFNCFIRLLVLKLATLELPPLKTGPLHTGHITVLLVGFSTVKYCHMADILLALTTVTVTISTNIAMLLFAIVKWQTTCNQFFFAALKQLFPVAAMIHPGRQHSEGYCFRAAKKNWFPVKQVDFLINYGIGS